MSGGVGAAAWSAADVLLRQGLQFAVIIVLARLITPEEFGTVALLALFIGIARVIVDGGFSTALIQTRHVTSEDESTVFWANVALGAAMAGALCLAAPALAAFYDAPILQGLSYVMAVDIFINSTVAVHLALLTRRLDFRPILLAGLLATLVSGLVAVTLALKGEGVWALAGQAITMTAVSAVVLWLSSAWRPRRTFSRDSAVRLFGFGGYIFAANLVDAIFQRLYTLLFGRLLGVREVGFYHRAETTQQVPVDTLGSISARVALPLFSKVDGPDELRQAVRTSIRILMFLNVPLLLGLAAVARPFILTVFGARWEPVAPLLAILCLAGALWPMQLMNVQCLMAQGYGRLSFLLEIAKKSVGIVIVIVGAVGFGLLGLAWGQVLFAVLALAANTYFTRQLIGYGLAAQLRDVLPGVLVSVPAVATAWGIASYWDARPAPALIVASLGAIGVFCASLALSRPAVFTELLGHVRSDAKVIS